MSFEEALEEMLKERAVKYMELDEPEETLSEAIMRIYADERTKECRECEHVCDQADEFAAKGELELV